MAGRPRQHASPRPLAVAVAHEDVTSGASVMHTRGVCRLCTFHCKAPLGGVGGCRRGALALHVGVRGACFDGFWGVSCGGAGVGAAARQQAPQAAPNPMAMGYAPLPLVGDGGPPIGAFGGVVGAGHLAVAPPPGGRRQVAIGPFPMAGLSVCLSVWVSWAMPVGLFCLYVCRATCHAPGPSLCVQCWRANNGLPVLPALPFCSLVSALMARR
jgi:hypothetical protein